MLIPLLLMLQAAVSPLVGETTRPDTDSLMAIKFMGEVVDSMFAHFQSEYPNEGLVCLYGGVVKPDTVRVGRMTPAKVDSAGPRWLQPADEFCEPHTDYVGFAHNHPQGFVQCHLSGRDVAKLDEDRQALFGIVFCPNGVTEFVWQDGRIGRDNWLKWYEDDH